MSSGESPSSVPPSPREPTWREILVIPLGLVGAIAGAVLGGYLYAILHRQGYIAPFLIGGFVGFGTILLPRRGGLLLALLAAVVSLVSSIVAQWVVWPWWQQDIDFLANLRHLGDMAPVELVLHAAGAVLAFVIVSMTPAWRRPGTAD